MYRSVLVNLTAMMAVASCLEWPAAVQAYNANRYGKQQLSQKQNRYGIPTWPSGVNRAGGWASSYGVVGGGMLRHHPVSAANRYREMAGGNRQILSDDYYDSDVVSPYERPRPYDRLDYAVVRYPSYGVGGGGGGYYPVSALAAYDDPTDDGDPTDDDDDDDDDDDTFYENDGFGGAGRGPVSSPYYPTAVHRHAPPLSSSPSNRHDPARYPTDKIHKFRKVFMSNLVSPSNAFKSTKEQQLYDFWESLINGDLEHMGETDDAGRQQWADGQEEPSLESETGTSKLYQHLPLIFQQLQKQQKQKQHQQHRQPQQQQQLQQQQRQQQQHQQQLSVEERTPVQSPLSSLSSSSSSSSSSSPSSPLSSLSTMSHTVPHGNLYKQWANGSPLIKRSSDSDERVAPSLMTSTDNDEVRQLEKLKTGNPTANTTETAAVITDAAQASSTETGTAAVPMADGGQREYVLPRPAGEKSGFESLLEVIAEGGLHGNFDKNVAYSKLRQEAKVDKKRSYVSDETSLAAQLGALRKN